MINTGCSNRKVIIDYGCQYTDTQIESTQKIINELYKDIILIKGDPPLMGLIAVCNINYSTVQVIDIVGEAFIYIIETGEFNEYS